MPPVRVQKRKSSGSAKPAFASQFPVPPTIIPTKSASPTRTPERSPAKRTVTITKAQKQALIDNLQLEITERARKLRAQYALQAQGLRSRLEMRVNRIPHALRRAKMGELSAKYTQQARKSSPGKVVAEPRKTFAARISPAKLASTDMSSHVAPAAVKSRGVKRSSDDVDDANKENADADLSLPKKRAKTVAQHTANTRATRIGSRKVQASTVLSPKSNNSRTLPRPPIMHSSPAKPGLARPSSPVKPAVPVANASISLPDVVETKPQRVQSRQNQKPPAPPAPPKAPATRAKRAATVKAEVTLDARGRAVSNSTNTSDSSAGTTIVTKTRTAPPTKRGIAGRMAGISAVGKKVAAAATGTKEAPSLGRRVLRKRG